VRQNLKETISMLRQITMSRQKQRVICLTGEQGRW
jgi:hypothetical protein